MARTAKLNVVVDNNPYIVKVVIPTGAWAYQDSMHEFHIRNGIAARYRWYRTSAGDVLEWDFQYAAHAEFFIAEFGGELLPLLPSIARHSAA
jgi:hypothetical protein